MRQLPRWVFPLMIVITFALAASIWWMKRKAYDEEVVWADTAAELSPLPVKVEWDKDAWGAHSESFVKAMGEINSAVKCQLFEAANGGGRVKIVSANGEPCGSAEALVDDRGHAAQSYRCPDGTYEIHVSEPGDTTTSYLIVMHELGHVVGLAHDGRYVVGEHAPMFVSVMTPNVADHARRMEAGKMLPTLSEKDAKALRERYCR